MAGSWGRKGEGLGILFGSTAELFKSTVWCFAACLGKDERLTLMPHVFACHAPSVDSDLFQASCFPESSHRCQRPGPEVASCIHSLQPLQCLHADLGPVPTHGNAATDVDETRVFCQYTVIRAAGVTNVEPGSLLGHEWLSNC